MKRRARITNLYNVPLGGTLPYLLKGGKGGRAEADLKQATSTAQILLSAPNLKTTTYAYSKNIELVAIRSVLYELLPERIHGRHVHRHKS